MQEELKALETVKSELTKIEGEIQTESRQGKGEILHWKALTGFWIICRRRHGSSKQSVQLSRYAVKKGSKIYG